MRRRITRGKAVLSLDIDTPVVPFARGLNLAGSFPILIGMAVRATVLLPQEVSAFANALLMFCIAHRDLLGCRPRLIAGRRAVRVRQCQMRLAMGILMLDRHGDKPSRGRPAMAGSWSRAHNFMMESAGIAATAQPVTAREWLLPRSPPDGTMARGRTTFRSVRSRVCSDSDEAPSGEGWKSIQRSNAGDPRGHRSIGPNTATNPVWPPAATSACSMPRGIGRMTRARQMRPRSWPRQPRSTLPFPTRCRPPRLPLRRDQSAASCTRATGRATALRHAGAIIR
jgi:hypothetical protein